jgi:hypothetical protein
MFLSFPSIESKQANANFFAKVLKMLNNHLSDMKDVISIINRKEKAGFKPASLLPNLDLNQGPTD